MFVAAVIQSFLVQVGEQLHPLETARGGLGRSPHAPDAQPQPHRSAAPREEPELTVGKAALGSPLPLPGSAGPTPQSSARYLDADAA